MRRLAASFTGILCSIALQAGAQKSAPEGSVSKPNVQSALTSEVSYPDSVTLGGIGAGYIRLGQDGKFRANTSANQLSGDIPGSFAAVSVKSGAQANSRVLALHSAYGLPAASGVNLRGWFPHAALHCSSASFQDADVSLEAFSPFIPGDLRNSSLPAALLIFHIVNHSASEITASVALSWENCLGASGVESDAADRAGYAVSPAPDADGCFAMTYGTPENAHSAPGSGSNMCLMARPFRNRAIVTTASWNAAGTMPAWWDSFTNNGTVSGTISAGVTGTIHAAGVIAVELTLRPREIADIPMCVAWYTPERRNRAGEDYGRYYQNEFADSYHAARALLGDWRMLQALTDEWQRRITESSLPRDTVSAILSGVQALVTNSVLVRDGRFTMLESAAATPPHSYLSARAGVAAELLALFPQLYDEEMTELLDARARLGVFPTRVDDWSARLGPATIRGAPDATLEGNPIDLPAAPTPEADIPDKMDRSEFTNTCLYAIQADMLVSAANDLVYLRNGMPMLRSDMDAAIRYRAGSAPGGPGKTTLTVPELRQWLTALHAARRFAGIAVTHAFEWAPHAGALGSAPGALEEIATNRQFISRCDAEIGAVESKLANTGGAEGAFDLTAQSTAPGRLGLASAAAWGMLARLEGFNVDLTSGELDLTTPIPGDWRELHAPVFSATFVGEVVFKPAAHGGSLTLRIDRTITLSPPRIHRLRAGDVGQIQLTFARMRIAGPPPVVGATAKSSGSTTIEVGASLGGNPIGCTVQREPGGALLLVFSSPVTMSTGDRLLVEVH